LLAVKNSPPPTVAAVVLLKVQVAAVCALVTGAGSKPLINRAKGKREGFFIAIQIILSPT
jgi:hypothetical protein